jgi:membrane protease YdiL (CAAX protease family)
VPNGGPVDEAPSETPSQLEPILNATANVANRTKREIWLEVSAVLALGWMPYFVSSLSSWVVGQEQSGSHYIADSLTLIAYYVSVIAVVLYLMHRSGEPWKTFGIGRFRPFADPGWGVLIVLIDAMAVAAVYRFGLTIVDSGTLAKTYEPIFHFDSPSSAIEMGICVLLCLSIGGSEEIVMRGYLIPRFESLLESTWKSVLLTTIMFASYHVYQGAWSLLWISATGIVLGCAFCFLRRLWPVVIGHAMIDLLASLP